MIDADQAIDMIYEANEFNEGLEEYHRRHEIKSMCILTITSPYSATREVDQFAARIRGRIVIEIGAGVGYLALEMARFAKHVYAIEADPAWSWFFTEYLYQKKPANLTYIFGRAQDMANVLRGEIAIVYTRSGHEDMAEVAQKMCPEIIWGPVLPFDELHADVPLEILEESRNVAATIKPEDIVSRRGIKPKAKSA